ncbi:MAG: taurine catabolism dioxygenase tauD/tfdA [Betaproteobacteria bacterium]|nr:taurine catabolism dioxygenase tauD/tfdA [Betaproteobacteria bacterium]
MNVTFKKLHPHIGAEVSPLDLRQIHDRETLDALVGGMDEHGVLVFRDQPFTDAEQLAFAERFGGPLHKKPGIAALAKNRFDNDAIADIGNINEDGGIRAADDRKRAYSLANRLWHTDASFQDPPGRYSTLSARVIPPVGADTEFADMQAAYDDLDAAMKKQIEGLHVHHSIAYSRQLLGFDFSPAELEKLKGAVHPLVHVNPRTGRRSLYLAAHATRVIEMALPEGRLLLRDLTEHATQRQYVYRHAWKDRDLVIWDNQASMHRSTPFEDARYPRELRRITTIDVEVPAYA